MGYAYLRSYQMKFKQLRNKAKFHLHAHIAEHAHVSTLHNLQAVLLVTIRALIRHSLESRV
jgi:hypothetical protein